jgi:hypothetical protein
VPLEHDILTVRLEDGEVTLKVTRAGHIQAPEGARTVSFVMEVDPDTDLSGEVSQLLQSIMDACEPLVTRGFLAASAAAQKAAWGEETPGTTRIAISRTLGTSGAIGVSEN